MKKKVKSVPIVLLVFMLTIIPSVKDKRELAHATQGQAELGRKITAILQDPHLNGALAGVSIRSASTGKILYDRDGNTRLRPASNMKLLTAAAALEILGEQYVFQTEVLAEGPVMNHLLHGDLYLKGKGDPSLLQKDFDELALKLKKGGIKTVSGNLIGDDSWFDQERYSFDLAWTDEQEYYGAQISALTVSPDEDYDAGSVILKVSPANRAGKPAAITVSPQTDYVEIINHVQTSGPDAEKELKMVRKHGTNIITMEGTIPLGSSPDKQWSAVWEPTGYALDLFDQALKRQGIKLLGRIRTGKVPETAAVKAVHSSMPLSELMVPFMKLSNNSHAEVLVKELGRVKKGEGSWKKGLETVRETAESWGLDTHAMQIRDGSGISQADLFPANEISKLLYKIQKKPWFLAYLHALPTAGASGRMEGGTLRKRMKNTAAAGKVFAKTGTISSCSTLSGYATAKNGEKFIFSILINNFTEEEGIQKIQDDIAVVLASEK
ncbi:D-alanyl-D-alanine carboxypeptidase/D-alanyl-D-alanine-endopeptidase [Peribacillus sp. B-H-3]|uniref:D-alanyl-D-alanine carboxypeptidase/D-alanyl-D-alanine endopeptidase n=1 Tax=Peribacillus sp. B-H-3 TaxID=3400420 RepID=UPI003B02DF3B